MSASASRGRPGRSTSEYADVPDMFRELAELTEDTAPFQRQRDRIVERCLPLAASGGAAPAGDGADAALWRRIAPACSAKAIRSVPEPINTLRMTIFAFRIPLNTQAKGSMRAACRGERSSTR